METDKIYLGNSLEVLKGFPNNSVDCIVTSPPYYKLRKYSGIPNYVWGGDENCEHDFTTVPVTINNRNGLSSNTLKHDNYREHTNIDKTESEMCVKCGSWKGQLGNEPTHKMFIDNLMSITEQLKRVLKPTGSMWINLGDTYNTNKHLPRKTLMMIPQRYAIRCIDDLRLILRNDVIWAKPNGLPESVKDRYAKKHEHFLFFTKQEDYYFDLDSVRVPYQDSTFARKKYGQNSSKYANTATHEGGMGSSMKKVIETGKTWEEISPTNPLGKNPGDFWLITTKPSNSNHYASYNDELIDNPIKGSCPLGGIVLDPFAGTGTTPIRSIQLGRKYIGIEGSTEYYAIAINRIEKETEQYRLQYEL